MKGVGRIQYIVLGQIWMIRFDAIVQEGDHHILAGVVALPGCQDVHLGATAAVLDISRTMLMRKRAWTSPLI